MLANMAEELDILKIVKEDILEVVGRENKRIPLEFMQLEVAVSKSFVSRAVKELEQEGLIRFYLDTGTSKEYIGLTEEGKVKANVIIEKHSILEKYLKERRSEEEAIKATHIIEHYVSSEVIENIKKLSTLKRKSVSLIEFEQEKGLIADINPNIELFERLISMGICPGETIRIAGKIPGGIVIEINNKKFVLAKEIAKEIEILEYEKS